MSIVLATSGAPGRSTPTPGRPQGEAVDWRLPGEPPVAVAAMEVTAAGEPPAVGTRRALSSLEAGVARDTEERGGAHRRLVRLR